MSFPDQEILLECQGKPDSRLIPAGPTLPLPAAPEAPLNLRLLMEGPSFTVLSSGLEMAIREQQGQAQGSS